MIYFDNAATTCPYPEVLDRMRDVAGNCYANPHAMHAFGVSAERLVNESRKIIADSLKVASAEIIFTSGGTESNNLALRGMTILPDRYGRHILASAIEHPSVLEPLNKLAASGYEVELLPLGPKGVPDPEETAARVRPDTRLLSLMHVNNESGAILPIAETVRLARKKNHDLLVHVDAVQSYGKLQVQPKLLGADLVSFSAHKLHGPKGVGALYVRKGVRLAPQLLGGGQEGGMRSGTLNVPGICGFATAVVMRQESLTYDGGNISLLRARLIEGLTGQLQDQLLVLSPETSSPYILQTAFEKVKAEVLLHHLAERGIFVSSGSACSSRKDTRSHVVKAMHVPDRWQGGIIRFSFSSFSTMAEVDETVQAVSEIYPIIRYR